MSGGVEVKALCRPVKFFHTKLGKPFFLDLALCTEALFVMLKLKKIFKLLLQSWKNTVSFKISLSCPHTLTMKCIV